MEAIPTAAQLQVIRRMHKGDTFVQSGRFGRGFFLTGAAESGVRFSSRVTTCGLEGGGWIVWEDVAPGRVARGSATYDQRAVLTDAGKRAATGMVP